MFPIMLFGILGNLCIITIILKNRLLRLQPTNVFLLNLAISDFLHLCINPILFLSKQHSFASKYYLGGFTCHLTPMVTGKSLLNHRKILILIFHENEIVCLFKLRLKVTQLIQNYSYFFGIWFLESHCDYIG